MVARVYITLKEGVLDVQGKTVQKSLRSLGFESLSDVRMGKYIELKLPDSLTQTQAKTQVKQMCEKLLANTVIENYRFELL